MPEKWQSQKDFFFFDFLYGKTFRLSTHIKGKKYRNIGGNLFQIQENIGGKCEYYSKNIGKPPRQFLVHRAMT